MGARRVQVFEYGRLFRRDVQEGAWRRLRRLDVETARRGGERVFDWSHPDYACAGSWVGVLHVPGLIVEVLPKLDSAADAEAGAARSGLRVQANLLRMLRRAGWMRFREADIAALEHERAGLLEIHAWVFAMRLREALAHGLDRDYVRRRENLPYIKGRLVEPEHSRRNHVLRQRAFVEYDDLVEDTPLNRVLKGALRVLSVHVRSTHVRSAVTDLVEELEGVDDRPIAELVTKPLAFHRGNQRFRLLADFAHRVLGHQTAHLAAGDAPSFALLIPMEQLFEAWFGRLLVELAPRLALQARHIRLQSRGSTRHLLIEAGTGRGRVRLLPDVLVEPHERRDGDGWFSGAILDTKWKRLRPDLQTSDIYQMAAYAQVHDLPDLVLVHPRTAAIEDRVYRLPGGQRLRIAGLPVDTAGDLDGECVEYIRRWLGKADRSSALLPTPG